MSNSISCQAFAWLLVFVQFSLFLTTYASSLHDYDDFLLCLDNQSHPQYPTSEATYTQHNSSYSSVLQAYARNARFQQPQTPKPLFIITAKHVKNIQATIRCCKIHGLEMRIRSGGHDMEGLSYVSTVPFIILDMFNLRDIDVDIENESAWVQAGATLGDVYYSIARKSPVHAFPGGVCPTVGTAGHFSEGGYGNLMRMYGLASDNILDALIVDVQGRVLNKTTMGEDLFWAIRGGGAASFGVLLAWKIKLVRVPPMVTIFRVQRTLQQGASQTLYRWQEVAPNLPKTLYVRFQAAIIKDDSDQSHQSRVSNKLRISFIGMFLGQANQLVPLLSNSFPELKLSLEECSEMPWVDSVLFWADFPKGTSNDILLDRKYEWVARKVKSDYVKKPIQKEVLDLMWKELLDMDGLVMEWNPYGGRMSEISEHEIAYPHRQGNLYKIEYDFKWYKQGIEVENQHIALSRRMYNFMAPYVSNSPREAFFNYRDLDIGTHAGTGGNAAAAFSAFGNRYYRDNFLRLTKAKTEIYPLNFFRDEQSIPPLTANEKHKSFIRGE